MGILLVNQHITAHITDIIEKSQKYCFLVSPFYDPWPQLLKTLELAKVKKKKIVFLTRDNQRHNEDILALHKDYNFDIYFIENLHAKIYLNENNVLITSMNLLQSSKEKSFEVGHLIKNAHYAKKVLNEVIIDDMIKVWKKGLLEGPYHKEIERDFYCIRCKSKIPYNCNKPLCDSCFPIWEKYKNEYYPEKYCHKCGNEISVSVKKPLCDTCFAENWHWIFE
jgi:phosphatidylserine/phosphatidylglycerophosphate/cardiolipin synthase-like enzyme